MPRVLAAAVLLFLAPTGFAAQTDVEVISGVIAELDRALVAKDAVAMDRLLADSFLGVIPSGASFAKGEYIAYHCRQGVGVQQLDSSPHPPAAIRVFGDSAVVNRRVRARFRFPDGSERQFDVQRIEILVKVNGVWLLASGQGTEVNPALRP